jgi:hypothetical protein
VVGLKIVESLPAFGLSLRSQGNLRIAFQAKFLLINFNPEFFAFPKEATSVTLK